MSRTMFLVVLAVAFCFPFMASAQEDGWLSSLDEGLKLGKEKSKMVLVDFTATWCGWCTKLKTEVFDQKSFQDYAGDKLILVSIDADKNRELVDKYKVNGFPTVLVLDGDGNKLEEIVGFRPLEEFLKVLKDLEGKTPAK